MPLVSSKLITNIIFSIYRIPITLGLYILINTLLLTQKGLKAVTQWLISQNVLDQFRVAKEIAIEGKGASNRRPLLTLR